MMSGVWSEMGCVHGVLHSGEERESLIAKAFPPLFYLPALPPTSPPKNPFWSICESPRSITQLYWAIKILI